MTLTLSKEQRDKIEKAITNDDFVKNEVFSLKPRF